MPSAYHKRPSRPAHAANPIDECTSLIYAFANGREEAEKNLRRKLEQLAEEVAHALSRFTDCRDGTATDCVEIDVEKRAMRDAMKDVARDHQQYFGTYAGHYRDKGHDAVWPSYTLSLQCVQILSSTLLFRDIAVTETDDAIFHAWLGILTRS